MIRHLDRPNAHAAAFSFGIAVGDEGDEDDVESVEWEKVVGLEGDEAWRVVGYL